MSIYESEDIAQWRDKKMENKTWQVEPIETIKIDKHGIEENTWKGYGVSKISDPVKHCFLCRDEEAANDLCDFLNEECNMDDTSVEDFVLDNCIEWSNLINELSRKEIKLHKCKAAYQIKSDKLLADAKKHLDETEEDIIKNTYGGNNDKTRKQFVKESLVKEAKEIKTLEFRIKYISRRMSYLKKLVAAKTALIEVKKNE